MQYNSKLSISIEIRSLLSIVNILCYLNFDNNYANNINNH